MLLARLPAIKTVFNIGQYVLSHAVGFVVLRAIAGEQPEFGPLTWIGTFVAMQVSGVLSIALLTSAMSIAEGRPTLADIRHMFRLDAIVTPANTSLALLAAVVVVREPTAVPIMIVPLAAAAIALRAYARERERSETAEFLYEANRTLSNSPEIADAIEGLLAVRATPSAPTTPRSSCSPAPAAPRCARASARTVSATRWNRSTTRPPRRCASAPPTARSRSTRRSTPRSSR